MHATQPLVVHNLAHRVHGHTAGASPERLLPQATLDVYVRDGYVALDGLIPEGTLAQAEPAV